MNVWMPDKLDFFDAYGNVYPGVDEVKANRSDTQWRIRNLYACKPDIPGAPMKYSPRPSQEAFYQFAKGKPRVIWVKARGDGGSLATAVRFYDMAQYRPNCNVTVVGLTEDQAQKMYVDMYLFLWENTPKCYMPMRVGLKQGHLPGGNELVFDNGSSIKVVVETRGGTNHALHITELGTVADQEPDKANRIKTGAFPTLRTEDAYMVIESTPHGPNNMFHQLALESRKVTEDIAAGRRKYDMTDRLLFFSPWFNNPRRTRKTECPVSKELLEYFADIEARCKTTLTNEQRWWYANELDTVIFDKADMHSEYPSTFEEGFEQNNEDRVYENEMRVMRAAVPPRIAEFTYDPRYPVHTAWDMGGDGTAIIFFQVQGNWITIIWYYEYESNDLLEGLAYAKTRVPWPMSAYGIHAGPHDAHDTSYLNYEENAIVVAAHQGFDFVPTERPKVKANGILAVRMIFPRLRVDQTHCSQMLSHLENYKWKRIQGQVTGHPVHNKASHCADAAQTLALYIQEFSGPRHAPTGKVGMPSDYHSTYSR